MVLAYYAKVERYRTYSNGKRVGPDVFYDYGHSVTSYPSGDHIPGKVDIAEGIWCIYYPSTLTNEGDSIVKRTTSIQVSKMLGTRVELTRNGQVTSEVAFKDWNNYRESKPVDANHNLAKDFDNSKYPRDDRPSGWYYQLFMYSELYTGYWSPSDNYEDQPNSLKISFDFYDQFLVIDGRRIDFSDLHKFKVDYSLSETDFSDSQKEGKIEKLEMRASYLGKNFYSSQTDTIYVAK